MKIVMYGKKFDISDNVKSIIEKKLSKLDKFFNDDAQAKVTLSVQKSGLHTVEVTVFSGGMIYRAEESAPDLKDSLDRDIDILSRQIRKNKTRLERRLRDTAFDPAPDVTDTPIEEESNFNIVRHKRYSVKPMSPEEAVLQMNLLGHSFFVFQNAQTDEINLVYRRNDKDYGLIELD